MQNYKLYLASKSPRRREILEQIGLSFEIICQQVQEEPLRGNLDDGLCRLAWSKAEAARSQATNGVVLGADTVVLLDGEVFGKPKDERDARRMLGALSGRWHQVKTGVCAMDGKTGRFYNAVETTDVLFKDLSEQEIDFYIQNGEPFGKAGAYAVQGVGARFVKRMKGCYYNVVGLPVVLTLELIDKLLASE